MLGNHRDQQNYHPFKSHDAKSKYLEFYDKKAEQWPVASENIYIDTSFGQTFVRISGPENAPPLVLLQGDSVTSLDWIPLIEQLSKDYRVFAPDQIYDVGRSIYSRKIKRAEEFVQWLEEFFIEFGLDNIKLMGYSYGGWLASLYALSYPKRLNKLVLLSPASTVLPGRIQVIIRAILYYFIPTHFMAKNYMYWQYADSVRKDDETKKIIDEMIVENLLSRKCFKSRNFVRPTVLSDNDWQSLEIPTLFLTGKNETIYSAVNAVKHLNSVAPAIKTVITSNAGHDLPIIKPKWVSSEVLKFLK